MAVTQLVERLPIGSRVGGLQPDSSWPYVEVSLGKSPKPLDSLKPTEASALWAPVLSLVKIGESCVRKGLRHKNLCQLNMRTMIHCADPHRTR